MGNIIIYLPVVLAAVSSLLLFISKKWRWNILALAVIYVSVFWMVLQVWPLGLAVVKLIAGWMAGAILGSSVQEDENISRTENLIEQRFKIVIVIIIWIFAFSITDNLSNWLPIPQSLSVGGFILIATGLIQIGMASNPIRLVFGLMTTLAGFEVLYAGVENSVLVAGFLSIITLGIALVGVLFVHQEEGEMV